MLFRNPFRFGKKLPWKPAGSTKPNWEIRKGNNTLLLEGLILDDVYASEAYNESFFSNARLDSAAERTDMGLVWARILRVFAKGGRQAPPTAERLTEKQLTAIAVTLSYGIDDSSNPRADETALLRNFMAYLNLVLGTTRLQGHVQPDLVRRLSAGGDPLLFGKPVWEFPYPDSSFFVTDKGLPGCCIAPTARGDVVFAPLGSTYPLVLRPRGRPSSGEFSVCGYAFVYGVMLGELQRDKTRTTVVLH
ncbi:hypothetical protein MN608_11193 [Microdochium nivale]|nr:hypothetical protein MN608_11193 [Microdochium nivale]